MKKKKSLFCFLIILISLHPSSPSEYKRSSLWKKMLVGALTICIVNSSDNAPSFAWTKSFGGINNETGNDLGIDSQGNFWGIGSTSSYGSKEVNGLVTQYNAKGERGESYAFGGRGSDELLGLKMYPNDSFTTAGYKEFEGDTDFLMADFDTEAFPYWQMAFGKKNSTEKASTVDIMPNGNKIEVGWTDGGQGGIDMLVVVLNTTKDVIYSSTIGSIAWDEYPNKVKAVNNTHCIITGYRKNDTWTKTILLMLDFIEGIVWQNIMKGSMQSIGNDLVLFESSFWWIGEITSIDLGIGGKDICIGKHTLFGQPLVFHILGGNGDDIGKSIDISIGGTISILAEMESFGAHGSNMWLGILHSTGSLNTSRVVGGQGNEYASALVSTPDQGSAAIGTKEDNGGNSNILVTKVTYEEEDCGSLVTPTEIVVATDMLWGNSSFFLQPFNGTTTPTNFKRSKIVAFEKDTTLCTFPNEGPPSKEATPSPLTLVTQKDYSTPTPSPTTESTTFDTNDIILILAIGSFIFSIVGVSLGVYCWSKFWRKSKEAVKEIRQAERNLDVIVKKKDNIEPYQQEEKVRLEQSEEHSLDTQQNYEIVKIIVKDKTPALLYDI